MLARWQSLAGGVWANRWVRFVALTLWYLAILGGLVLLYGKRHFETPPFVYQGF
jgi:hypothetical protein